MTDTVTKDGEAVTADKEVTADRVVADKADDKVVEAHVVAGEAHVEAAKEHIEAVKEHKEGETKA